MSDAPTAEVAETVTEEQHTAEVDLEQYPPDHPLVKTLVAQKAQLKELRELGEFKELKQFKELQAKASRLDEIEEAQKSEAEKVADRLARADAMEAEFPSRVCEAIKPYLIKLNPEIDTDKAELFLTATDPELLMKQWAQLVELSGKHNRGNVVPREGRNPNPAPADPKLDFLRSFTGQG